MPRPKSERHSSDLVAEIARLEQERKRLIQAEDQRRGSIIRECLAGLNGDHIRDTLRPFVSSRDAFLFGLDVPRTTADRADAQRSNPRRRKATDSAALQSVEAQ